MIRLYSSCIETNFVQPFSCAVYCIFENCHAHMADAPM